MKIPFSYLQHIHLDTCRSVHSPLKTKIEHGPGWLICIHNNFFWKQSLDYMFWFLPPIVDVDVDIVVVDVANDVDVDDVVDVVRIVVVVGKLAVVDTANFECKKFQFNAY